MNDVIEALQKEFPWIEVEYGHDWLIGIRNIAVISVGPVYGYVTAVRLPWLEEKVVIGADLHEHLRALAIKHLEEMV